MPAFRPLAERFYEKISPEPNTGCWLWTGAVNSKGYGNIGVNRVAKSAHRVAYLLAYGPIPEGKEIDHVCRVRSCVNPAHMQAVTHVDNIRRAVRADQRGERNPKAKLTPDQARAIYADRRSGPIIAAEYGVTRRTVNGIRRGLLWKHLWGIGAA